MVPEPSGEQLRLFSRKKGEITNVEDWRLKRDAVNSGWVPGKSAWETAYAWVGSGIPSVPGEIRNLLDSHQDTRELVLHRGVVELKTHLHHRPPSGPRNHDLALWASSNSAFIGIESKADDGFAESMREQYQKGERTLLAGKSTRQHLRGNWLSQCLVGQDLLSSDCASKCCFDSELAKAVLELPYQLFAGVAGTLLEAKRCRATSAVFVVHQFRTRYTDDNAIKADSELLDRFLSLLIHHNSTRGVTMPQDFKLGWGWMMGPIYIEDRTCGDCQWDMPTAIPLFIGKALTNRLM